MLWIYSPQLSASVNSLHCSAPLRSPNTSPVSMPSSLGLEGTANDSTQWIPPYWPSLAYLFVTSLESAHLADPLLPGEACAQETDPSGNGHHGHGRRVPQVVCLPLHHSMQCHVVLFHRTTLMQGHGPRCVEREENGKKAGETMRGGREEKQDQVWPIPCH